MDKNTPFDRVQKVARFYKKNESMDDKKSKLLTIATNKTIKLSHLQSVDSFPNSTTLIFSRYTPSHLRTVLSYAIAVGMNSSIKNINILLTDEWRPFYNNPKKIVPLKQIKQEALDLLVGNKKHIDIFKKINIKRVNTVESLSKELTGVVFRFLGTASFFSTYVAADSIYQNFPVICATFSSKVKEAEFNDILLIRDSKFIDENKCFFTPPTLYAVENESTIQSNESGITGVCSVHGNQRLEIGLGNISATSWKVIVDIFEKNINLNWYFVGATLEGLKKAPSIFPFSLQPLIGTRIHILGHTNLDDIYDKSQLFIALPGATGGANGARQAISKGHVLLSIRDNESDISTLLPSTFQDINFKATLNKFMRFLSSETDFYQYRDDFLNIYTQQANIEDKSRELLELIKSTSERFENRTKRTNIAIFGDSHSRGFNINEQINNSLCEPNNYNVYNKVAHGSSLIGLGRKKTVKNMNNVIAKYVAEYNPDYLVLAFGQVDIELGLYYKKYIKKENVIVEHFIDELIEVYISFINSLPISNEKVIVKGINIPVLCYSKTKWIDYIQRIILENKNSVTNVEQIKRNMFLGYKTDIERTRISLKFNSKLEVALKHKSINYYDINSDLTDEKSGLVKLEYVPAGYDHHVIRSLKVNTLYLDGLFRTINNKKLFQENF